MESDNEFSQRVAYRFGPTATKLPSIFIIYNCLRTFSRDLILFEITHDYPSMFH